MCFRKVRKGKSVGKCDEEELVGMNKSFCDNREYWDEYYGHIHSEIQNSTQFASFIVEKWLDNRRSIVEYGCGNGRDCRYFRKRGLDVTGVDSSKVTIEHLRKEMEDCDFVCADFSAEEWIPKRKFDVVYSRFSIHAISLKQEIGMLENAYNCLNQNGIFCIEARSINDDLYGKGKKVGEDEYIYNNHYRRFARLGNLLQRLIEQGFDIRYAEENKGFAPLDGEDPSIIRIVCEKVSRI